MRCRTSLTLLGLVLCLGCAEERAVRVRFSVSTPSDTLCVFAGDGRDVSFVQAYERAAVPDPATLTFVAGSASRSLAVIGALSVSGGRVTGTGHLTVSLGEGELDRSLEVSNCRRGAPMGLGLRPSGTFAALHPRSRLFAADLDGDGREELLAVASDGSLAVLDAEDPDAGSRRTSELLTPSGGRIAAAGDFDGDCRVDLLVTADVGVLRLRGIDGGSPAPIGPTAPGAAVIVELASVSGPLIAVAGAAGLSLLDPGDGTQVPLSPEPITYVVAGDFDGDGSSDILLGGAGSPTRIFLGAAASPREQPGAGAGLLAPATGPAVVGDFDGDGADDVALVDATSIRVLSFGSGTLAEIPTSVTVTDANRLAAGDLDGDCAADLVVLDGTTVRTVTHRGGALVEGGGPGVPATDLAIGDVDGDGARDVALLGAGGRVTLWAP